MLIKDADYSNSNWVALALDLRVCYGIQDSDNHSVIETKVRSHFESEVVARLNENKFESYLEFIQDFTKEQN